MVVAQATPPTSPTTGMIWIDTANNFAQYVRTATAWISTAEYQVSTGTYEWRSENGNKSLAFSPPLTDVGRNFAIDLRFFTVNAQLSAPNNTSNYWSFQPRIRPGGGVMGQIDTPAETVTSSVIWRQFVSDLRGQGTLSSGQFLSMILTFAGAPGFVIFNAAFTYKIRLL